MKNGEIALKMVKQKHCCLVQLLEAEEHYKTEDAGNQS